MEEDEHVVKRQKLENDTACRTLSTNNFFTVTYPRANNLIEIYHFNGVEWKLSKPWFIHQLFDNEELPLHSDIFPSTSRIVILVDGRTLDFIVKIVLPRDINNSEQHFLLNFFQEKLSPGIPPETPITIEKHFDISNYELRDNLWSSLCQPIGTKLKELSFQDKLYSIYRMTYQDLNAALLLSKCEKLAIWYIETASSIDFQDDHWEMLVMYTPTNSTSDCSSYSLVGYVTLFTFHNPFLGSKLRVCQMLITPSYLHCGFGRQLLLSVYYDLLYTREIVTELTVEDPCALFRTLRDQVDYEIFYNKILLHKNGVVTQCFKEFQVLPSVEKLAKQLKLIPSQIVFLVELYEFACLLYELFHNGLFPLTTTIDTSISDTAITITPDQTITENSNINIKDQSQTISNELTRKVIQDIQRGKLTNIEDLFDCFADASPMETVGPVVGALNNLSMEEKFQKFRLKVKKQLLKEDKELTAMSKKDMQHELTVLFEERLERYIKVIAFLLRHRYY
jgi:hypothetical protein